jgi:hypothetical protein
MTVSFKDGVAREALAVLVVLADGMVFHDMHDPGNNDGSDDDNKHDDNKHDDIPHADAAEPADVAVKADVVVLPVDEEVGADGAAAGQMRPTQIKYKYKNKLPFSCVGVCYEYVLNEAFTRATVEINTRKPSLAIEPLSLFAKSFISSGVARITLYSSIIGPWPAIRRYHSANHLPFFNSSGNDCKHFQRVVIFYTLYFFEFSLVSGF